MFAPKARRIAVAAAIVSALLGAAPSALAELHVFDPPAVDAWMYPFAGTPGIRTTAPTFGAFATAGAFDQRDAQALFVFDTTPAIPADRPPEAYMITSVRLVLDRNPANAFVYDPSYDGYRTYLALEDPLDPDALPDTDAGRPIELYGVGYRLAGLDATTWDEATTPYGPPGSNQDDRYSYASDYRATPSTFGDRDVSNNVRDGFDPVPFAVGVVPGATVGSTVTGAGVIELPVSLHDAAIAYLQERLAQGSVDFMATSLAAAAQGGPPVYPGYLNKESGTGAATLEIDVRIAACGDGADNDGDGHVDFPADPQCSSVSDGSEKAPKQCGLFGIEIAGVWWALRRRRRGRP